MVDFVAGLMSGLPRCLCLASSITKVNIINLHVSES